MTRTATLNWLAFALALAVSMVRQSLTGWTSPPEMSTAERVIYFTLEAGVFTLGCAIPAFVAQVYDKKRGARVVRHHWTFLITLVLAFGSWYAYTHPR